ncbi:MAG: S46 family peptidase, partial [Flavobacteriales bacterium]|nr:S46 family peptidase [Flavobacteriales bacterium]
APPGDVGKFGGDTDNWVWPRHTGDFSVFRIYADKNNEPAAYSKDNVPFKPAHFLPVNIGGVKEGDYSMVYGFPGRTDHLLTSFSVDFIMNKSNPMRIDFRNHTLAVLEEKMRSSDEIRIKYAAKQSGIANAWKKWQGQQIGLTNINAVAKKQEFEKEYQDRASQKGNEPYSGLLAEINTLVNDMEAKNMKSQAFVEFVYYGPELFNFAHQYRDLVENFDTLKARGTLQTTIDKLKSSARLFYKDFDLNTEKAIYASLEPMYMMKYSTGMADSKMAIPVRDVAYVNARYDKSIFRDSTVLFKLLDKFSKSAAKKITKDYFYKQAVTMFDEYNKNLRPGLSDSQKRLDFLMQQYTEGMMKMFPADYWSDANSTLRITFGKVEGSEPRDGEMYKYYTTADGILEKYATHHPDFELNNRLQELFKKREYGNYAENGELHICYTGSNHTTGGNSGSPALNAKGELTGINFDRSWESTMSDIVYNPDICRNIMVDIRYVLWVIDVYAEADYLLEEMRIVR